MSQCQAIFVLSLRNNLGISLFLELQKHCPFFDLIALLRAARSFFLLYIVVLECFNSPRVSSGLKNGKPDAVVGMGSLKTVGMFYL